MSTEPVDDFDTLTADVRFGIVPEWVILHPDLPHGAVRLYALLAFRADQDGRAYPGVRRLAQDVNASTSTVERWVGALESVGAIRVRRGRPNADGAKRQTSHYLVIRSAPERSDYRDVPQAERRDNRDVERSDYRDVPQAERRDYRDTNVAIIATKPDPENQTTPTPTPQSGAREGASTTFEELRHAIEEACGLGPDQPMAERRSVLATTRQLEEVAATVADVERRARAYRDRWPGAALTPAALARHWSTLGSSSPTGPAPVDVLASAAGLGRTHALTTMSDEDAARVAAGMKPGEGQVYLDAFRSRRGEA